MATYSYMCETCGGFDVSQPITAKPLTTCPMCDGRKVRKIFSPAAVQFKGTGFYSNDKGK